MSNAEESAITLDERKAECKPIVLIVDDNPEYAKLFELLADRLGISVHVVNSCSDAVEALKLYNFDVIMMDWLMPEVDGPKCTGKIRMLESSAGRHTAIIGVSGADGATHAACIQAGMDDFLPIPFSLEELHDKLCLWLRRKDE